MLARPPRAPLAREPMIIFHPFILYSAAVFQEDLLPPPPPPPHAKQSANELVFPRKRTKNKGEGKKLGKRGERWRPLWGKLSPGVIGDDSIDSRDESGSDSGMTDLRPYLATGHRDTAISSVIRGQLDPNPFREGELPHRLPLQSPYYGSEP